jgi:hypothetical protein
VTSDQVPAHGDWEMGGVHPRGRVAAIAAETVLVYQTLQIV